MAEDFVGRPNPSVPRSVRTHSSANRKNRSGAILEVPIIHLLLSLPISIVASRSANGKNASNQSLLEKGVARQRRHPRSPSIKIRTTRNPKALSAKIRVIRGQVYQAI